MAKAPFECLLNADIEPNPHQVNAFCAAIQALKTGGIILADEVGLGKTIEAGLVLNYVLDNGAKKVLISLPATLRKQWEVELLEKFGRQAVILDRYTVEHDLANVQTHLGNADEVSIVIASYDYSSKLIKRFPHVKWDFLIIDEAHNLRNVFHGTKRAKNLYDLTHGIPKILLTATPLQNSLTDLHGLVSFIDPRIFGSEKVFNRRFVDGCDYEELKQELLPVLYRTLRRDVGKYMAFSKRTCITVDFHLSAEEKELYDVTNDFLRRDPLYSIPNANRGLIILVIRKLLASSSFALIETFEVLEKRLEKLYEGTKSAYAQEGFDLFWGFVEDEIDEDGFNEYDDEETAEKKQAIQAELKIVRHILEMARAIKTNAKIAALREALKSAFDHQISEGLNQKAVVFTESKRTQKYIAAELRRSGYSEEDILLFNGDFDDAMTKEIFRTWKVKNFGKTNYGRSVEYKHAIVDYFKSHAKILIVTDAGSEGLNLQFCNTIINYDLPWNPQKIEQRIGRCHRYGQTHDVVAINLLNTDNEADRRVYDILSKKFELFEGVFGASDVALGALESGVSFEKRILDIYQNCKNITAVRKAFAALNRQLDARKNAHVAELRSILLTESREAKGQALEKTKADIDKYLRDVEYWNQFEEPEVDHKLHYWKIDNWGEKIFGSHIFVAEHICRKILAVDEFYFAQRPILGRGRGCAATWKANKNGRASEIVSTFIPEYEFPGVSAALEGFDPFFFSMRTLSVAKKKDDIINRLNVLANSYEDWIQKKLIHDSKMDDAKFKKEIGDTVINKCIEALGRIRAGIQLLVEDDTAFDAFCFMNRSMILQRNIMNFSKKHGAGIECAFRDFVDPRDPSNNFGWRPFQIAFILINLKGIVDPEHDNREVVDLLYFPTGGGKTEAYLGLMAFVIANRRLRAEENDEYNRDGGVTAILRYTLRLLTTQQRDRITKMILAAELIRQKEYPKYGKEPISIGFWVGGTVTPNTFKELEEAPEDPAKTRIARSKKNSIYKQLLTCPFCGKPLTEENFYIDIPTKSVSIYCSDDKCMFYRYKPSNKIKIPVYLVDEEIYAKCPTIILSTVDKFARLPWDVNTNALFGRVDRICSRDGYVAIGADHARHNRTEELPTSTLRSIKPFLPPELIIQDELHLITGPLGTVYGAYETVIEDLCSYTIGEKKIKPKYVVSTATIKNAAEQTKCLYGRKVTAQFPPNGFEIGDSFYIREVPVEQDPFRRYVGVCAPGQSVKTALLRVYSIILQSASPV